MSMFTLTKGQVIGFLGSILALTITVAILDHFGVISLSTEITKVQAAPDPPKIFVTSLTKDRLIEYILSEQEIITKPNAEKLATSAIHWSQKYKVPVFVVLSVIDVETNFKPYSISGKNAHCHMQIVPKIWSVEFKRLKIGGFPKEVRDLHDIDTCIKWGTKILQVLKARHKTWSKAVYNYNPGDGQRYLSSVKNASIKLTWSTM